MAKMSLSNLWPHSLEHKLCEAETLTLQKTTQLARGCIAGGNYAWMIGTFLFDVSHNNTRLQWPPFCLTWPDLLATQAMLDQSESFPKHHLQLIQGWANQSHCPGKLE
jgi:hypothetical protein